MNIISNEGTNKYFDVNGTEIHEGDTVFMDGKLRKVYLTEEGELGTDATNPSWIEKGLACETEFGIYPFSLNDNPVVSKY